MSLLDDVSIVVTPNGYKAGELYAVVPVPTEGAEEITNGDFATDANWTKNSGWTISGGSANCDGTQTGNSGLVQQNGIAGVSLDLQIGKQYKMVIDVTVISGAITYIEVASDYQNDDINATGVSTLYFSPTSTNDRITIAANSTFVGSVNSVSVKEYTAADMDVTRATAATRVDEAGLVNYAEVILDTQLVTNGDFASGTTGWSAYQGSLSVSNGNLVVTATANSDTRVRTQIATVVGKSYILTAELKSMSGTKVGVANANNSFSYSGNVQELTSTGSYSYYFTAAYTNTSIVFKMFGASTGETFSLDNVSVKEVTRDNVPRIDYTGGGCPHILAEPQRTNLITFSNDFSNAIWQKQTGIVPTYNTTETLSPDGTNNATKFIGTGSTGVFKSSVSVSGNISRSVYLKSVSGTTTAKFKDPNATGGATPVNLTITNEWQRFKLIGDNGTAFQGLWIDDITSDGLYMWGAQLEEGSYATSIITTSGSTVTRNQDQFSRDGIGSLIGQTEGTFFIELSKPVLNFSTQSLISLNNAASNSDANSIAIGFDTGDDFFIRLQSNNVLVFQETETNADANTFYKVAISYKSGESLMYLNGSPLTPTSGNLSNAFTFAVILDNLSFDFRGDGALPFFGKVKQLQVYKTALTDTQLAALTS